MKTVSELYTDLYQVKRAIEVEQKSETLTELIMQREELQRQIKAVEKPSQLSSEEIHETMRNAHLY